MLRTTTQGAMAAAAPKLVWVTGWAGCGTSTLGHYLALECGWRHVDVEHDFLTSPRGAATAAGWLASWDAFFKGHAPDEQAFGPFLALVLATINVVGGFMVTGRMLEMFQSKKKGS